MKNWLETMKRLARSDGYLETQYDDTHKTSGFKARRFVREKWGKLKPLAMAGALGATILGTVYEGTARLNLLDKYDVNHDGIEDTVVIYPIKGTDKGLVGYLDGRYMASVDSFEVPEPFSFDTRTCIDTNIFHFHPLGLQLADRYYNDHHAYGSAIYVSHSYDKNANVELNRDGKPIQYLMLSGFHSRSKKLGIVDKNPTEDSLQGHWPLHRPTSTTFSKKQ